VSKPNVVFIIADQHRWEFLGHEADGVTHALNLNRIAEAGTTFRAAGVDGNRQRQEALSGERWGGHDV